MASLLLLLADEQPASSGGGAPPAPSGHLTSTPSPVAFAATQTGTAAPDQPLTLSNTGNAALMLSGATVSGTNAADFSLGALPAVIATGASATLTIHCTPSAVGARAATLSIAHNGDNTPTAIPLAATGVAPAYLTVSPAALAFPVTRLPGTATLTLTLTNTGGEPLTYATAFAGLAAGDYTISTGGSGTIAGGASATLTVACTPSRVGSRPATLTITDNASDGPTTAVAVSGSGQPPVGTLHPYARLIDIRSNTVVATTTHVAGFSRTIPLDAPLTGTLSVPASDPGQVTSSTGTSFGTAALQAAGTDDGATPVPTIVEVGVSGPSGVIAMRLRVTAVTRSSKDGAPVIDITGEGPLAGYAGQVIAHAYYPGCQLVDVLGAAAGTIVPVAAGATGFLSPNGAIPYLGSLFSRAPGLPAWNGKALMAVTPAVDASIAGISTNLETRGDTTLRALEAATKRMAGDYIAGDAYPVGYRGHYYEDPAGLSSAGNAVVVGVIGGSPATGFTLDGNGSAAVDETVMARIIEASIETNSADTYGQVLFTGGKSNAGLPEGATITGLGLLNPIGTGDRTDYTTCLPIISYHVDGKTGGVAFFNGDGLLRPLLTGAGPVYSLYVDTMGSTLYIGTADGVLARSSDVRAVHAWSPVGTLHARIDRLAVQRDNAGSVHVFAQARPKDINLHGLYSYVSSSPGLQGAGHDDWTPAVVGAHVQSFVMTDYQTAWILLDNDQGRIHQVGLGGGSSTPFMPYALPAGVRAFALDRVITAGDSTHPGQDSVWAMTKGDSQSAYMLVRNGATWGPFAVADADGSLAAAAGGPEPTINGATGLGLTIGGTAAATGQYTSVFVATSAGLYWSATLDGKGWKSACGLNGLSGVSIAGVVAGQYQGLQGELETRFFAFNPKQFFYSSSDARYWRDLTKEELHLGPFFADLARTVTGDLPSNAVITIGPMATSPIGNPANTHIQVTGANQDLPAGWYWQRRLDDCNDWSYVLVNGNAPTDACLQAGLTDLQTNTAVTPLRASGDVARVARRWLSENSVPARTLKARCPLTRQESALWTVRPGQLVTVNLQDQINQLSADGSAIVGTQVVHMVNASWWVIEATIALDESGGSLAYADLTLSTVLRKDKTTPSDMAAGLADQIKSLNAFGAKG